MHSFHEQKAAVCTIYTFSGRICTNWKTFTGVVKAFSGCGKALPRQRGLIWIYRVTPFFSRRARAETTESTPSGFLTGANS